MPWWTMLLLFQQTPMIDLPAKNPYTGPADIEMGRRLFQGRCAGCHGPTGEGGKGANLAVPQLTRGTTDPALYRIVRFGIPDTEMPGKLLDVKEIAQIAAFVRTLGRVEQAAVTGDARRGETLFRGKGGCLGCHAMGLEGGRLGPALNGIGARRGVRFVKAKIEDASADVPEKFRVAKAKMRDGRTVEGVRLNEDTYSIQLRDMGGKTHSLWKEELADLTVERKTLMPAYKGRLSDGEINDIVAYLAADKGR
jgi:cytochrome c oxidase cbb3-type subunit III